MATGPKFFPGTEPAPFVRGLADVSPGPTSSKPCLCCKSPRSSSPTAPVRGWRWPWPSSDPAARRMHARHWRPPSGRTTGWSLRRTTPRRGSATCFAARPRRLILPNLPAFLRGEYQPRDNDERLALVGTCQSQGRYHAAARLYAEAFTADPDLADNLTTECRYRSTEEEPFYERVESVNTEARYLAARCAALAGCGLGEGWGRAQPGRAGALRKQARAWLRADLAPWGKTLASGSEQDLASPGGC